MGKMNSRLNEMLAPHISTLKAMESRVAEYLLAHEDQIQDLSISTIADDSGVSKATVVRFCKALGFNGLKDFKIWYEAGKNAMHTKLDPITEDFSDDMVISSMANGFARTHEAVLSPVNYEVLQSFAADIQSASSVCIIAEAALRPYVDVLVNEINLTIPGKAHAFEASKPVTADVALVLSVGSIDKVSMGGMSEVILNGGKADVVTSDPTSLQAKAATRCILTNNDKMLDDDPMLLGRVSLLVVTTLLKILLSRGSKIDKLTRA